MRREGWGRGRRREQRKQGAQAQITVISGAVIVQWFKGERARPELCAGISGYILSACSLAQTTDQITPCCSSAHYPQTHSEHKV